MMGNAIQPPCPRCGFKLVWDGQRTVCLGCSYISLEVKSDRKFPAVRSPKKHKKDGGSSRP